MRERRKIGVVLPVGPDDADSAFDTLASILHYLNRSAVIVAIDDTDGKTGFARRAREMSPAIEVLPAPARAPGGLGGLWVKIAAGYRHVLERYDPGVILRLDVDALIIGAGLEVLAAQEFARNPKVGLLGAYRVSPDGTQRDWSWAARHIHLEAGVPGLRYPARRTRLRQLVTLARQHGYTYGEHALGGAYIHSLAAARDIYARGWFDEPSFATSKLGEDHIMGLVTRASGYRIADFDRPEDPMALEWQHLPSHPEKLLADGKLITHSVRVAGDLREPEIRRIFREARAQEG
jgi:hypothetical protein